MKIWYLSAYPKGIQDVGVFFSSVDPILIFLGQTVLVCLVCAFTRRRPVWMQREPERMHTRHTPDACAHSDHLAMVVYKR